MAQVKTRVNRSSWVTVSEQCNHILMLPRWVPETPGPGEAQVEPESPGTEEAKVRTRVTRIRSVPVGNRVTMSR